MIKLLEKLGNCIYFLSYSLWSYWGFSFCVFVALTVFFIFVILLLLRMRAADHWTAHLSVHSLDTKLTFLYDSKLIKLP